MVTDLNIVVGHLRIHLTKSVEYDSDVCEVERRVGVEFESLQTDGGTWIPLTKIDGARLDDLILFLRAFINGC
jgi:hypothetical protein